MHQYTKLNQNTNYHIQTIHPLMNYNQGPGQSSQTPQQQQYARQGQKMSMLPPQFQNLSPQELQELKNQPQFQNAMRQYYQRQQLAQQQSMRQGQNMVQNLQAPGVQNQNLQSQNLQNQNIQGQNLQGQNLQGLQGGIQGQGMGQNQNLAQQQLYNRNLQQAYLLEQQQKMRSMKAGNVNRAQMMGGMVPGASSPATSMGSLPKQHPGQIPQQMRQQIPQQGAHSIAAQAAAAKYGLKPGPGMIGGIVPGAIPPGSQGPKMGQVGSLGGPPNISGVTSTGGATGSAMANLPSPDAAEAKATANLLAKETVTIPPKFAADSVSKVQLRPLKSATEWSDKLKEAGEEVPLDVKVYEDIIKKDEQYLRKFSSQNSKQKQVADKLALDIKTYNSIKQLRMNSISASAKNQYNNSIWGEGYQGYGNGVSNTATSVVLPHQNKSFTKVPAVPLTDAQVNESLLKTLNSGKPQHLVPVRLDFDQERDRFKLRDTFLWDLNDETYPLENFVRTLIEDYKFISSQHLHAVLAAVNEQIKDYRKKPEKTMGEIRVPIKIDLIINNTQFTDQFEWDILNFGESDPEDFATVLCDELSLPGEFSTAIAFSIREQAQLYHKALHLVGYSFDGSFIREDEIRSHLLPALRVLNPDGGSGPIEDFVSTLRNPGMVADFSPSMNKLTQSEIEKIDKEMERESRRRRRHFNSENSFTYNENSAQFGGGGRGTASRRSALHSGRGVKTTLPDLSDTPKNFRTPMPSSVLPGGIDLGVPDIYGYNELIINRTQVKNPDYKPPAPPGMVTSFRDSTGSFYVKIRFSRR